MAPRHRRGPWWGEDWALQTGNIDALDQGTYRRNEDGTWERSGLNIDITYSVGVNGVGDGKGNIIKGTEVYILYIDEIENGYVVSTASLLGDDFSDALGFASTAAGTLGFLKNNNNFWRGANGKFYSKAKLLKDYYGKGGKYVRGVQGYRNSEAIASEISENLKGLGRVVGVVGLIFTVVDASLDGFTTGDVARIGIYALTVFTPIGWAYGLLDLGTQLVTGTSITERIGSTLDKHLVLW